MAIHLKDPEFHFGSTFRASCLCSFVVLTLDLSITITRTRTVQDRESLTWKLARYGLDCLAAMSASVDSIEPALAFAREQLRAASAERRTRLQVARDALKACRVYLGLHRPPAYRNYNPAAHLKARSADIVSARRTLEIEPVQECVGDPDQMVDCIKLLVQNIELEEESSLVVEVFEEDSVPRIALSLDGPGRVRDAISVGGYLQLSLDELGQRWTAATRGGRIDRIPNGLMLRLKGVRMVPETPSDLARIQKDKFEEITALVGMY